MLLRTDTPPADAFAFARMGTTLPVQTPRTLRRQVGARTFGDFGAVLLAQRLPADDLSDRVARLRALDEAARAADTPAIRAQGSLNRPDGLLHPHPDQSIDDRRLRFAMATTMIMLTLWIALGVGIAAWTGRF